MTREFVAVLIYTAGIGVLAIGCAVQGQPFEKVSPPPAHAVIYVYRPYAYGSSALRPNVTCGEDSVRIGPGGYHAFMVPVGQKVVCSMHTDNADEVEIKTDARVYYIREELGWGLLTGQPHLNPVDNDKAQTEIQSCVQEQQAPPAPQVQ